MWVATGVALAGDAGLSKTLKAVEDRYNHAQTLQLAFSEGYSAQGKTRKPETGTLFLSKPGRMRWQYTFPSGKLFLSDGKFDYMIVPDSTRVQKTKVKESDDLRTPLAFLLGRLHFEKDFQNFQSRPEGEDTWITADAPQGVDHGAPAALVTPILHPPTMTPLPLPTDIPAPTALATATQLRK